MHELALIYTYYHHPFLHVIWKCKYARNLEVPSLILYMHKTKGSPQAKEKTSFALHEVRYSMIKSYLLQYVPLIRIEKENNRKLTTCICLICNIYDTVFVFITKSRFVIIQIQV